MRKCYLVTTDHLEEGLWFRDDEDFITGMNYVAIQAARGRVTVLAFILMRLSGNTAVLQPADESGASHLCF